MGREALLYLKLKIQKRILTVDVNSCIIVLNNQYNKTEGDRKEVIGWRGLWIPTDQFVRSWYSGF